MIKPIHSNQFTVHNITSRLFANKLLVSLCFGLILSFSSTTVRAQAIVETFEESQWTSVNTGTVLVPTITHILTCTGAASTSASPAGRWFGTVTVPVTASSASIEVTGTDGLSHSTIGPAVTGTFTWAYSFICGLNTTSNAAATYITQRIHSTNHAIIMQSQSTYLITPSVAAGIAQVTFWYHGTGGINNPISMALRTATNVGALYPTTLVQGAGSTTANNAYTLFSLCTSSYSPTLLADPTQYTYDVPTSLASKSGAQFIIMSNGSVGQPIIDDIVIVPGVSVPLGTMPTMCTSTSITTALIPYGIPTGGSTSSGAGSVDYTVTGWSGGGLGTISSTLLNSAGGNISISVPANTAAGTYTGKLTLTNAGSATYSYPISVTVISAATAVMPTLSTLPTGSSAAYSFNSSNATDDIGSNDGIAENGGPVLTTDRYNNPNEAYSFTSASSQYLATTTSIADPTIFTISAWFKTTTLNAGLMVGFSNSQTTAPSNYDRNLFILNGQVCFGIYQNAIDTVHSGSTYNDGNWHLATATVSTTDGTKLYVDGVEVSANTGYSVAQNYTGYWHIGYNNSWYGVDYFNGDLDDISIYNTTELTQGQVSQLYTGTLSNPNPVCSGSTLTLTETSISGATYAWTGPATITSPASATATVASPVAGTYSVSIKGSNGCVSSGSTVVSVIGTTSFVWTGAAGTSTWATAGNWECGIAPTLSTANIVIPNVTHLPALGANTTITNLTIYNTAALTVGSHLLTIKGVVSGDGTLSTTSSSGIYMMSTSSGTLNFTSGSNTVDSLRLDDGTTTTIGSPLNIASTGLLRVGTISGTGATLVSNGNVTLVSDNTGTAYLAPVPNGFGAGHTSTITGNVNVQVYVHSSKSSISAAHRAWRLLTAPITNSGASPANTIYTSWQNSANYEGGGHGTMITGPGNTGGTGNGLDAPVNGNYSLYTWDPVGQKLSFINNTVTPGISNSAGVAGAPDNVGYFIFVRGDRDTTTINYPTVATINNTTLNASGILQLGTQTFTSASGVLSATNSKLSLIGNPYAAPVNVKILTADTTLASYTLTSGLHNVLKRFYVWNANKPGSQNVGGYVCIDNTLGTGYLENTGVYATGGSTAPYSDLNIQSGQSFFVQNAASGSPFSVVFNEIDKTAGAMNFVYRPEDQVQPVPTVDGMSATLALIDSNNNVEPVKDGIIAQFKDGLSDSVDDLDAPKFTNSDEMISLSRGGKQLSIERRTAIATSDTLFLSMQQMSQQGYQLSFSGYVPNHIGLGAHLEDTYTGLHTPLNLNGTVPVNFAINGDVASQVANRFMVVFGAANITPAYAAISATKEVNTILVQWAVSNDQSMSSYALQRSADGVNYTTVDTVSANHTTGVYSWTDNNPVIGINYYRVISTDVLNEEAYSAIVHATIESSDAANAGITVFPNPIQDGQIIVSMANMPAGQYRYRLFNSVGQEILTGNFVHAGGNAIMPPLQLNKAMANGTYRLDIVKPDNSNTVISVVVD